MILALDQGTTSSRAILFDHDGTIQALARRAVPQIYPRPGWVEHDANGIWAAQSALMDQIDQMIQTDQTIQRSARCRPLAIGIANQRETTVVWDRRTGEPLCNAIVWQDRRTADMCDRLRDAEDVIRKKTGLRLDPYFSATKIAWILDHVPGARARADHLACGTIDSWLVWKLTSGRLHITDPSNASRTLLFDIHQGTWDDELLEIFDVPRSMLPDVRASSEVYGETDTGIPLAGIAGDQQAALFGQAGHRRGLAKNTYGTGCFLLLHTGTKAPVSRHDLLTTVAWRLWEETEYALEGSVFTGGAVVSWLRDGLGLIGSAAEIEALAGGVEDSGDVYLVPAFVGLGAPHWDPYARGLLIGLTGGTTAGHIARAALESIAFQVADLLDAMTDDAGIELTELRVDGGAAENDLLLQTQADLLGVPIVRPRVTETTALGAAYLAGLAVGFWKDRDEIAAHWAVDRRFEPRDARALERRARWREAVARARGWASK